jgi:hypothetical protein
MTTMSNPGRAFVGPGQEGRPTTAQLNGAAPTANWPIQAGFGSGDQDALLENGEWGIDYVYGNFVWDGDATASFSLRYRPIWPNGRWLLLKNAHTDATELQPDTAVAATSTVADNGFNKYAINWTEPLGPADGTYGGYQDNDSDQPFPFAPASGTSPTGTGGFLSVSEFCTDCHDGTAGASTQSANVYKPGTGYVVAYAHDAQPRH